MPIFIPFEEAMRKTAMILALSAATPAGAHPHAFTDVDFSMIFGAGGAAEAVRITWVYDELTSLMVVTDRGLDADGDGMATDAEKTLLQGFDQNWDPGFPGDFYIRQDGHDLVLSPPADHVADYRDGKLISTFTRRIEPPAEATRPLTIQGYDPTFYTAYTLQQPPVIEGRDDCQVQVIAADIASAQEKYGAALALIPPDQIPDESQFGDVGRSFADEVQVTCPAR